MTERFNRSSRDFDFTTPNPVQAAAQAAYAQAPIPEIAPTAFRVPGGLTFLGVGGQPRTQREMYWRAFMPRVGLAWQARPNMVVRAGWGMFFGLVGADFSDATQPGFSQRSNIIPSNDNGITYAASIPNPLPNGLAQPAGASGGMLTYLGQSPGFSSVDGRRPYTQRWSGSIQLQPLSNSVIEIGYIGSKTVRLRVSNDFNAVPAQFLSTSTVRDQATIDRLSASVTNPFFGIHGFEATSFYSSRTIARSQLLRPYPEFSGLSTALPAGSSWYNAFTARFETELAQSGRHGYPIAVLRLDVDRFKNINDTSGHDAGDRVLASIGEVLRGVSRATDIPSRPGGDEFALAIPYSDIEGAVAVAERIRAEVRAASIVLSQEFTVSIGISSSLLTPRRELLEAADRAMYEAKTSGGDSYRVWREARATVR